MTGGKPIDLRGYSRVGIMLASRVLARMGVDLSPLFQQLHLLPLENLSTMMGVPPFAEDAFYQLAIRLSKDPAICLRLGEYVLKEDLGLMYSYVSAYPTLLEGLKTGELWRQINDCEVRFVEQKDVTRLEWHPIHPLMWTHGMAMARVSVCYQMMGYMTGKPVSLVAVHFRQPQPAYHASCEERFGAPVLWGQPVDALVLTHKQWNQPLPQVDPGQILALKPHVDSLLQPPPLLPWAQQAELVICQTISQEACTLENTAKHLNLKPSALRYFLKQEGTSFMRILSGFRRKVCQEKLRDGWTLDQISPLLGYQDSRQLHRAKKVWEVHPDEV
ncbi:MAG: AraC family transcriptional regulator ligand-binding domain-containing protein [Deltaproteobacteria bacterium]|nr:AraC family transcriptional regulator ligand-binding domain-containing protein [Deltaproteobacteria bacterium]